jgi:hypothetical protein
MKYRTCETRTAAARDSGPDAARRLVFDLEGAHLAAHHKARARPPTRFSGAIARQYERLGQLLAIVDTIWTPPITVPS